MNVKLLRPVFLKLGLLFSTLFISLLTAEFLLRLLGLGYGSAPVVTDPILHHRHPRNYSMIVHDPAGEFGGHRVDYDSEGLVTDPDRRLNKKNLGSAKYRIAFLGDSFVEAKQVPFRESFFGRLISSARDDVDMKNYGTASYSPVLYFLQYREVIKKFKPTHVFLMLYGNDVDEDSSYFSKAVFSASGELISVPGPGHDAWKQLMRNSYLIRYVRMAQLKLLWILKHPYEKQVAVGPYIEENPDISKLTESYVLKLSGEVKRSGAQFTLTAVPSKYQLMVQSGKNLSGPEFSEKWRLWAGKHGIDFLDLVKPFHEAFKMGAKPFFIGDIHFNSWGHRVIAQEIRGRYPHYFLPSEPRGFRTEVRKLKSGENVSQNSRNGVFNFPKVREGV